MNKILGKSPVSSVAGYALAGLLVAQSLLASGNTNWAEIALAAGVAVLGRIAADGEKKEEAN